MNTDTRRSNGMDEAATAMGVSTQRSEGVQRSSGAQRGDDPQQGGGLVHLYCGDGKGKTTAALGLALRALGHGMRVVIIQFSKDGTSGEVEPLRRCGATVYAGSTDRRFLRELSSNEREALRRRQTALLEEVRTLDIDMLVLDEACFAVRENVVDVALLKAVVCERPARCEVVLTGRNPPPWMLEAADYITEMRCVRHPYERGVLAREGVEY